MDYELNPMTWYSNREMEYTPAHFVLGKTSLTNESKLWVINNLRGRFSVVSKPKNDLTLPSYIFMVENDSVPAFEDPKEAVLYELKWG